MSQIFPRHSTSFQQGSPMKSKKIVVKVNDKDATCGSYNK